MRYVEVDEDSRQRHGKIAHGSATTKIHQSFVVKGGSIGKDQQDAKYASDNGVSQMGLRVVELFAGVGGFRRGLHDAGHSVIWWNQWEPLSQRHQYAYECYLKQYHSSFMGPPSPIHNRDISKVPTTRIPKHDLLVAGFPCQDYSVASPLRHSKGLKGKKGVLWWEITRILAAKKPPYVLLENVDRLLSSPKRRRGRDFAVVLAGLAKLGYVAEWRIVNAAHYGAAQKRRRVFIFAARTRTAAGGTMAKHAGRVDYLTRRGFFAKEFGVVQEPIPPNEAAAPDLVLQSELHVVSRKRKPRLFQNAGIMVRRKVWTHHVDPVPETPAPVLRSVIHEGEVSEEYFVPRRLWKKWKAAKGPKDIRKKARGGYRYWYNEGAIPFPDRLDQPARTLLTCEGGIGPSRTNHIIEHPGTDRFRVLTPEECEKLMGFKPGYTEGLPRRWRYFVMGNAVVVPIVERIGRRITAFIKETDSQSSLVHAEPEAALDHPNRGGPKPLDGQGTRQKYQART